MIAQPSRDGARSLLKCSAQASAIAGRVRIGRHVLADREPEPAPVSLSHSGQGLMPQRVRMLLDFAAPRLRARLG
jgi:hypothetical protein